MKITHLTPKQFRCFEQLELDLVHPITVLVGKDASGKTAVLDALTMGLEGWASVIRGAGTSTFPAGDVRAVSANDGPDELHYPASVGLRTEAGGVSSTAFFDMHDFGGSVHGDFRDAASRLHLAAQSSQVPLLL